MIYLRKKQGEGKDWRLYLNYCVMFSNFDKLPDVLEFAVKRQLPLVVNTINGMRHTTENMYMYKHLELSEAKICDVTNRINKVLEGKDYCFEKAFLDHYDYILKAYGLKKLKMSKSRIDGISRRYKGLKADRVLYILYRWQQSKVGVIRYLMNKVKNRVVK